MMIDELENAAANDSRRRREEEEEEKEEKEKEKRTGNAHLMTRGGHRRTQP